MTYCDKYLLISDFKDIISYAFAMFNSPARQMQILHDFITQETSLFR